MEPPLCPTWGIKVLQEHPAHLCCSDQQQPQTPDLLPCTWVAQSSLAKARGSSHAHGSDGSGSVLPSTHPLQGLDEDVSVALTPGLTACPRSEPTWQEEKKRSSQEKPGVGGMEGAGAAWLRRALRPGPSP